MRKARMNKNAILKARCKTEMKEAVDRVALHQQLDHSDIIRIAVATYLQNFATVLGDDARG